MIQRFRRRTTGWIMLFTLFTAGCASTMTGGTKLTKVVATFGYTTQRMLYLRAGGTKPRAHIIWGNDIPDETPCRIRITHVERATKVWEHIFIYNADSLNRGLNIQLGAVIELDKNWNIKPGTYLVELFARHRRVARCMFILIP
jgi:hypothetical protein